MHEIVVFSSKRSNSVMEWITECGSDPSDHLRGDGYAGIEYAAHPRGDPESGQPHP
jgi:hypothetical protein